MDALELDPSSAPAWEAPGDQSIQLYEASLVGSTELDTQIALRLGKLYGERISRLAASGRPTAASSAWNAAIKFTARAAKQHPSVVWQQAAAIAESALGKGLASQGMIDAGRRALTASLERAPSTDAYESLTTIDVQTARYKDAQKWADEHADDNAPRIALAEAKKDFDAGNTIFVDTRAEAAYKQEHIKGAINVPMESFEAKYKEIPTGKKIIAYCS